MEAANHGLPRRAKPRPTVYKRRWLALAIGFGIFPACQERHEGAADDKTGDPVSGPVAEIPDATAAGLGTFLQSQAYLEWSHKQPGPIDSVASHGAKSRTFFNDTAAGSSDGALAKDSVIVKELLAADGTTLRGHALMAKVEAGSDQGAWLWFEGFLPEYENPYYGRAIKICTDCHAGGRDFVRTSLPAP